ncbi:MULTISPECIES: class I SAM-dependent methyltransferase [Myroides]|uniref:Methyltransferase domain-containing protein n=1 Tax=Myroides albus TaxID=2562892 RepID=A0A6I3LRY5_9FLAO|nr:MULTISPECIES: class I SAM-dependent methyltransferase [Myroides]MTG98862.1 methyltransferase domain-containing protein [Myroides albus]MVX37085.1 methyltransferase domain-containing protein [Myroides sp. LoEW2-1]UVD79580.1 class I SAM-dependent methyltransferase [Myroides albus]
MDNQNLTNRYSTLASWVYHLDKPIGRSFGDIEFYSQRLQGISGKILEPATGNGRVLIPLLEQGFDISGFDASKEMLDYCKAEVQKRQLNPELAQERFEDFNLNSRYDAVILPAGSFQLITDVNIAIDVLKRFKAVLNEKGKLIIDLSPLSCLSEPTMMARSWKVKDGILTLTETREEVNFLTQTTTSQLRYEYWSNEGSLKSSELDYFSLRFWGIKEFELALKHAGFTAIKTYSNYELSSNIDSQTHTITFEAY